VYRKGSHLWESANTVLSQLSSALTASLVAKLPDDPRPFIQQNLTLPVVGGLAALAALGWWWVKR
jgi:hypothetical protein